jgi:uncharacterized membrane protein YcaP (DUF421 family)
MDLPRIVVRVLFGWFFVHALLRVSGKRTVKQGDVSSFVLAVVLGDLFDDLFWAEVPAAKFVVGAGALVLLHVLVSIESFRRGEREWRRAGRGPEAG